MLGVIPKGTADSLIYTIDWSQWLNTGDSLATSLMVVPTGLTLVSQANTTTTSTAKISGGTIGTAYTVTCTITTTVSAETKADTFVLQVTH